MKIAEIFSSIQGEGRYTGYPMLFIRTSGCTRACSFCDTKYHTQGKEINKIKLVKIIKESPLDIVCWTGGEPLLWRQELEEIIMQTPEKLHHIETNGDLLEYKDFELFNYLGISPKELETAKEVSSKVNKVCTGNYDIKVVTDMKKEGVDMLKYATMIMPMTYTNHDKQIQKAVWNYCVKHNLKFTGRLQYYIHGKKRKV